MQQTPTQLLPRDCHLHWQQDQHKKKKLANMSCPCRDGMDKKTSTQHALSFWRVTTFSFY